MENYFIIVFVIVIAVLLKIVAINSRQKRKVFENNTYTYMPKASMMSRAEGEFFYKLVEVVQERYFVFPQVHLSSLLDHHVKGQEWNYAFRHINGKSVDYVLCGKQNLRPVYAIELDDYTHDRTDRKERDSEVERIFEEANLPLVRFSNYKDLTNEDIVNKLAHARKLAGR